MQKIDCKEIRLALTRAGIVTRPEKCLQTFRLVVTAQYTYHIVVCQSGQGGISGVPARNPTISERIPRLSPEEARRRDKAIQLAALRKVQHAHTRAAVRHGKRKCAVCGILCSSLAVYNEHVAGRKHKRLAQDTLDGPQSCEPCIVRCYE
jgi:Zinc-finger of C2H2 type